jgi:hypothetical protein
VNSNSEEILRATLEKVEQLEEHLETLRKRHRGLRRRAERALVRLRDAVGELEEAERFGDGNREHIRNALELLYDAVHDLEVVENEQW